MKIRQLHMATFGCLSSWIWNISRRWGSQKISIFITWHDFDDHWNLRALKRAKNTTFWYAQSQMGSNVEKILRKCKNAIFSWFSAGTLKDASDTFPERGFYQGKKPRSIFEPQKRVLELWRWPSSQKASIFIKDSIGVHFTTARAPLRAETAPPPKVRPDFLKFTFVWGW